MDKRFEKVNIEMPLFKEGNNLNGMGFDSKVIREALKRSKNAPIIDYRNNEQGVPVGVISENLSLKKDCIKGKGVVWDKYSVSLFDGCLNGDIEYSIVEQHNENDVVVIDKLNLNAISINSIPCRWETGDLGLYMVHGENCKCEIVSSEVNK